MTDVAQVGLTVGGIASGVAGAGYLYRKLRSGVTLADLLQKLPERLDSLDTKVDALHERMDTAESDHAETLTKISDLDAKVSDHLRWSEGETGRRKGVESELWAAIDARTPDEN